MRDATQDYGAELAREAVRLDTLGREGSGLVILGEDGRRYPLTLAEAARIQVTAGPGHPCYEAIRWARISLNILPPA